MANNRKKRFEPVDENRSICGQMRVPDVSIAQGARRYAVNANLVFKWLKYPRFTPQLHEIAERRKDGVIYFGSSLFCEHLQTSASSISQ